MKPKYKCQSIEMDMTPMIDVTFQLITFFLFTLSFSDAIFDQRVVLPTSELAKPPDQTLPESVTIQFTQNGELIYNGDLFPATSLKEFMGQYKAQLERRRKPIGEATIVIRAHHLCKTGVVQMAIQQCQEVGFEKYTLRAMTRDSSKPASS